MKSLIHVGSILSAALLVASAGTARAQQVEEESSGFDHAVAPVSRALEIAVGGGYLQGAGDIAADAARVQDLSGPGGTVELKLGYRAIPNLAFGGYGAYSQFGTGDSAVGNDVRSASAGVYADWHFRPDRSVDPWVGLSSGWRGLWLVPDSGKQTSLQGWEIVRLQVGLDYKVSPEIAIAPVIGASVNVFLTQDTPATADFETIQDPRPNVFFFGGLQARFDVLGEKPTPGQAEQARR
jgi:hypothetical protein